MHTLPILDNQQYASDSSRGGVEPEALAHSLGEIEEVHEGEAEISTTTSMTTATPTVVTTTTTTEAAQPPTSSQPESASASPGPGTREWMRQELREGPEGQADPDSPTTAAESKVFRESADSAPTQPTSGHKPDV